MQIAWGRQQLDLDVPDHHLISCQRDAAPSALADPVQAMRAALDQPLDYPPLWRALTPEDHLAIVVDERIPQLPHLLVTLFEHIQQAGLQPDAITLICAPPSSGQPWLDDLPDDFQDVRIEVHQPDDRKKLAYLATTKEGRRVYLNRTAVDADQLVLLTRRGYDPLLGYSGAETALFPGLSDQAAIDEQCSHLDHRAPGQKIWPIQQEAREIAWLLGAPFFVQLIDGPGDTIDQILAGPLESSTAGERLLNACWRVTVNQAVDVVVATVTGDPAHHYLEDLARAYFAAARVVKPGGSIVLLTEAAPKLGPGFDLFRRHDDPSLALRILQQEKTSDLVAGFMWATAANQARLYLLSGLPSDVAEELFTIPLQNAQQWQKLLTGQATCLVLSDAHKTLAVIA